MFVNNSPAYELLGRITSQSSSVGEIVTGLESVVTSSFSGIGDLLTCSNNGNKTWIPPIQLITSYKKMIQRKCFFKCHFMQPTSRMKKILLMTLT